MEKKYRIRPTTLLFYSGILGLCVNVFATVGTLVTYRRIRRTYSDILKVESRYIAERQKSRKEIARIEGERGEDTGKEVSKEDVEKEVTTPHIIHYRKPHKKGALVQVQYSDYSLGYVTYEDYLKANPVSTDDVLKEMSLRYKKRNKTP